VTVRGAGVRQWIPMEAKPGVALASGVADPMDPAGLWVGTIQVERVGEVHNPAAPTDPVVLESYAPCACGSELPECSCVCGEIDDGDPSVVTCADCAASLEMRILLHVDTTGSVRLLKEVVQACEPDPADGSRCLTPVLFAKANQAAGLIGVAPRDGQLVPLRMSAASFDYSSDQEDALGALSIVSSGFGPGSSLSGQLLVPTEHPTNPYRHAYHRDHGGTCGCRPLDPQYQACLDACDARQNFDIERDFEVVFDTTDPRGANQLDWQSRRLSGCYAETLRGLHRAPLHLNGRLDLFRVSTIPTLGGN
ncbi:MAG: hypothetical protein K8J08_18830, partial [Thermoanaerobaculia bacterium]|nr:hypothetical protein [Thermoanaerobaculia bacterium]